MKSQNQHILKKLSRKKGITTIEAFNDLGCTRLVARIYDLRKEGHSIVSDWIKTSGSNVARYRLA
jgi:hypothetical protein